MKSDYELRKELVEKNPEYEYWINKYFNGGITKEELVDFIIIARIVKRENK